MNNLHIFPNEKFTNPYIEFINNNFNENKHLFFIVGKGIGRTINKHQNVKEIKNSFFVFFSLVNEMYKKDKVIIHGLGFPQIVLLLFLQPWLLKKCYWVIWGGDLYSYRKQKTTIKSKVYEMMRGKVIRNMGGLITHIKGDYELAREWYDAKGKYYYSFMYPSNLYKEYDLSNVKKDTEKTYIQVGNSADPSNNHIEVFEKLFPYRDENIEIACPLSYGNKEYAAEVIRKGKEMFGEKFNPLVDFMPFEEYLEFLAKIDIAMFNHKRQQAVGNITTLLGLGKKVYIRDDITTWDFCKSHNLTVFKANSKLNDLFLILEEAIIKKNIENVKKSFSEQQLKKNWGIIFNEEV